VEAVDSWKSNLGEPISIWSDPSSAAIQDEVLDRIYAETGRTQQIDRI
jgi:hypothetical protein